MSYTSYVRTTDALIDAAERPDWHRHAACRGRTAVMFPPYGGRPISDAAAAAARAICATCAVRRQCLAAALAIRPTDGVWAGLTATELRSGAATAVAS
jgi:hypothetical protein